MSEPDPYFRGILRLAKTRRCQNYLSTALHYHMRDLAFTSDPKCDQAPTVLLTQAEPPAGCPRGAIAVCDDCAASLLHRFGGAKFTVAAIDVKTQLYAERRLDRLKGGLTRSRERALELKNRATPASVPLDVQVRAEMKLAGDYTPPPEKRPAPKPPSRMDEIRRRAESLGSNDEPPDQSVH